MIRSFRFVVMFLLFIPCASASTGLAVSVQTPQNQATTLAAIQAVDANKWTAARGLIAKTNDPLAAKIYHWLLYTHHPDKTKFTGLTTFIRQNPNWPQSHTLRKKAEENFPRDLPDRDVVAWFDDYPPLTAQGIDRYLSAMIATGQTQKAKDFLEEWWATTLLPRQDQKHLYTKYNRYITRTAHLRRFDRTLLAGQYSNARALAGILGDGYAQLAEARIALAEGHGGVNELINRVPRNLMSDAGLVYERLRWRRENDFDDGAIELLNFAANIQNNIQNRDDWWKERHIIIRRLMENKAFKKAYTLAAGHVQTDGFSYAQAEWMAGFLALRFVNKPQAAYTHFQNLYNKVSTPISKSRGAYWSGRAAAALNNKADADRWYNEAARYKTTYYGQMAAAELSLRGDLPSMAPPVLTAEDIQRFQRHDFIQASLLFDKVGMDRESTQFLDAFVTAEKSAAAYRFAADLAIELKRVHDAVRISKDATQEGLFLTAQSFPTVTEYLKRTDLEWALVHALIRQESLFNSEARSPAGALGLMQLMPATAKETAQKARMRHENSWLTSRPEHNVQLGSLYMQELLGRFDGAYPLAIAGYNAGPSRVHKWVKTFGDPRTGEIDIVDWIELIPIYETRNYVQRVIENTYIYRLRLHGVQESPKITVNMATPQNLRNL